MSKFKKIILALILVLGFSYNVLAEETNQKEENKYTIKVEAETGTAGSSLEMSLEGFDKEAAIENRIEYFVKFVNKNDQKPVLSGSPYDPSEGVDSVVNSYIRVNVYKDDETDFYHSSIGIDDDWYMIEGYTVAYVIKCDDFDVCEVIDNPITVEKPDIPELTQRYQNFLFKEDSSLSVYPYFPSYGETGSHEINVKIGLIEDETLLKKISKNQSGSYEELMEYAKSSDGKLFTAKEEVFTTYEGVDIGEFDVINGAYYYMYTYYTNEDGLYRNLDDITVVMGEADMLVNDVDWSYIETDTVWDNFVDYFRDSKILSSLKNEEGYKSFEITSDNNNLSIKLSFNEEVYDTEYTYKDGIVTYSKIGNKYYDNYLNDIVLNYITDTYQYNSYKFYKYLYNNDKLSLEKNGIEYTFGELYTESEMEEMIKEWEEYYNSLTKEEQENFQGMGFANTEIFTELKVDLINGIKAYDESLIPYYEFFFGENQKYTIDKNTELKFEIETEFDLFDSVYVDGKKLDEPNFTVSEGSTVIVLKKEYLDKLETGKHILKVTFKDGEFAQTEFTIEKTIINPATGTFLKYGMLTLIVLIGVIGYFLIRKQSKFPKHN